MKRKVLVVGIIVLLITIGFSGCVEEIKENPNNMILVEIVDYELTKERALSWTEKNEDWPIPETVQWSVPWDLDISDITTNLSKRQYVCKNYVEPSTYHYETVDNTNVLVTILWGEDYWNYTTNTGHNVTISNFRLGDSISKWQVKGTAKNLADYLLVSSEITVYLYDVNNNLLDSRYQSYYSISAGSTWEFNISKINFYDFSGFEGDIIDRISFSTKEET